MGIEIAFAAAALAVGVISGVNQMNAANEQKKLMEKNVTLTQESKELQQQRNDLITAQSTVLSLEDRRQKIREDRVRRAAMLTSSENSGTSGSSGESGAISALGANFGGMISRSSGQSRANQGLNDYNQKILNLDTDVKVNNMKAGAVGAEADAFSSFMGIFETGFSRFGNIFGE